MEGTVLAYDTEGIIKSADGTRYKFSREEWRSAGEPAVGQKVDFIADGDRAKEIYLLNPAAGAVYSTLSTLEKSEKTIPTLVYACYIATFLCGITIIIGVVLAYIYRDSAHGKWYRTHYDYQISIFWRSLIGFLIGIPLMMVYGIGIVIVVCTYIWMIMKVIKGWKLLADGKGMPPIETT